MAEKHRRKNDGKTGAGLAEKQWPTIARQTERRAELLEQSSRGAAVFNAAGALIDCNALYCDVYELPIELMAPGTALSDILSFQVDQGNIPDIDPETYIAAHMNMTRKPDVQTRVELWPNGRVISVGHYPINGGGWITTLDDISDLYAIREEMEHSSYYDRRTSLPNKRLLMLSLDDALAQQWDEESFALIAIDFSNFDPKKQQVDKEGHHALMVQVADRILHTVRKSDVPAKLDGAQFAIIQSEVTGRADAEALARRLAKALSMPYAIGEKTIMPSFHIGVSLPDQDDINEENLLLQALEAAKQARGGSQKRWAFYKPDQAIAA